MLIANIIPGNIIAVDGMEPWSAKNPFHVSERKKTLLEERYLN